jgi:hypothetical protein
VRRETFADLGLQDAALDEAADAHSKASLGLTIQTLAVGLHYADGVVTQLQASVRAGLEVVVETGLYATKRGSWPLIGVARIVSQSTPQCSRRRSR